MLTCPASCSANLPTPIADCERQTRKGGIQYLVFKPCDVDFDITDSAAWCAAYQAGNVIRTPRIMGELPAASETTEQTSSCLPEEVTGYTYTITGRDYSKGAAAEADNFWKTLRDNPGKYHFGFIDCEGNFYGFIADWVPRFKPVIPGTNKNLQYWDLNLMWEGTDIPDPVVIAQLANILAGADVCTSASGN